MNKEKKYQKPSDIVVLMDVYKILLVNKTIYIYKLTSNRYCGVNGCL
jgi:hypothetical protein